MLMLSAC